MGSFVWHVREGSKSGRELASGFRYQPDTAHEPMVRTDDLFLEDASGPWRVIDLWQTDVFVSDGNILVVERTT